MLTEYLAAATLQERAAELARCRLAAEASSLCRPSSALSLPARLQARFSRSRSAASTAPHSLSTIEK